MCQDPNKHTLRLKYPRMRSIPDEASTLTVTKSRSSAFLSSVFQQPSCSPPNCRLPRAVRKHYSHVFTRSQNPAGDNPPPHSPHPRSPSPHLQLMKTIREQPERAGEEIRIYMVAEEASNVVTCVQLWHGAQSPNIHIHARAHTDTHAD